MSVVFVNYLTITGKDFKQAVESTTFNSAGMPVLCAINCEKLEGAEMSDCKNIVPVPSETPAEGWKQWVYDNWGAEPFRDHRDGGIIGLTENSVTLAFEPCTYAYEQIEALAKRFPELRFRLEARFPELEYESSAIWAGGRLSVFVSQYEYGMESQLQPPQNDGDPQAIRNELLATATTLIQSALARYGGNASVDKDAVELVVQVMAQSGSPVTVEFKQNNEESAWLYVQVQDRPADALDK